MDSEKEFQEKMRQLGTLVGELDQMPGGGSKVAARELVQLLMEVHRTGLERIMELVFESGSEPERRARRSSIDSVRIRSSATCFFSILCIPMTWRPAFCRRSTSLRARLRKFDSRVELVSLHEGAVQLRLHTSGHARGSTIKDLRSIVEGGIYDLAPDLTSLTILGPEEESSSGFVPLQSLLKHSLAVHSAAWMVPIETASWFGERG